MLWIGCSQADGSGAAGDAFYVPGGHLQRAEAGTEYLQFSPADQLRLVSEAIMKNMQQLQGV